MQLKVLSVPAVSDGNDEENERLNVFLRNHRILSVRRELVSMEGMSHWTFCVEYLEGTESQVSGGGAVASKGRVGRVDYRTVLDAEQFARFVQLRECRRQVAEENHVPSYALWNDDVQAELARLPELNKATMMSVKGIGKGTFEKYGERVIELLNRKLKDEKGGQSVSEDSRDGES
ncbi:MAG: HRDC domain-containing protein [Victivallales bacterium]|nr:HRDC domain-containing protein [Victivallales bacterium]